MPSSFVQFRMDDSLKAKAISICEQLGMDLPTYMRICVVRLVHDNGVPFPLQLLQKENKGLAAMKAASMLAAKNGISDMGLEEINAEIEMVRKKTKKTRVL